MSKYKRQQAKEIAMLEAIDKNLKEYRNGELFLCFRDHKEEKYYPISGDGKIFPELAGMIQMSYDEFVKEKKNEGKKKLSKSDGC